MNLVGKLEGLFSGHCQVYVGDFWCKSQVYILLGITLLGTGGRRGT